MVAVPRSTSANESMPGAGRAPPDTAAPEASPSTPRGPTRTPTVRSALPSEQHVGGPRGDRHDSADQALRGDHGAVDLDAVARPDIDGDPLRTARARGADRHDPGRDQTGSRKCRLSRGCRPCRAGPRPHVAPRPGGWPGPSARPERSRPRRHPVRRGVRAGPSDGGGGGAHRLEPGGAGRPDGHDEAGEHEGHREQAARARSRSPARPWCGPRPRGGVRLTCMVRGAGCRRARARGC